MKTNSMLIELQSQFDVPTTVEHLIKAATAKEWQNPATHNLQQSLAKAGKTVRPVQVVELCKPKYSGEMLEKNDERIVSVMMPCRISVYEKEDGKTYIALINTSMMADGVPASVSHIMNESANEILEVVNSIL